MQNNKKLNEKTIVQCEKVLLDIREKIVKEIKQISSDASSPQSNDGGDVSGHALHMADVATDMYDREFSLGLAANERELLSQVNDAIRRIRTKIYGKCETCAKIIKATRLKAIPYTKNCLKCQEKLDAK